LSFLLVSLSVGSVFSPLTLALGYPQRMILPRNTESILYFFILFPPVWQPPPTEWNSASWFTDPLALRHVAIQRSARTETLQ
jgi:hypothetical protein